MKDVFRGDIALAEGNVQAAEKLWSAVPEDDWLGLFEAGERFNRLNEYEKAIECFRRAWAAQEAPHKLDMVYSLAFLYKKLGRPAEAKKEWERILETLLTEYGLPEEDNGVRWARREISQLEP